MTDLDSVWLKMLDDAADDAHQSGRRAVSDYLRLRASNDTIRYAGCEWLQAVIIELASPLMRDLPLLTIHRTDSHTFRWESSTMVGMNLEIRQGVRCMTVETGWARRPGDGVMRRGALALGRISHFGLPHLDEEYRLIRADPLPKWVDQDELPIDRDRLEQHFHRFLER